MLKYDDVHPKLLLDPKVFIPHGMYCYTTIRVIDGHLETMCCPFWDYDTEKEEQENGYCHLLKIGDWMDGNKIGLLWDQCKECGINENLGDEK